MAKIRKKKLKMSSKLLAIAIIRKVIVQKIALSKKTSSSLNDF